MKKIAAILVILFSALIIKADNDVNDSLQMDSADVAAMQENLKFDSIINSFDYKKGKINLHDGLASINVPEGFTFLAAADAQKLLSELWGNPEDKDVLGIFMPEHVDIMSAESWAVVISYDESGYVKDDDAADINYDDLLKTMKEQSEAANEERKKEGYHTVQLVGWAQKPFYDSKNHKLHWAKELKFGTDSLNTLNYNIRMLGRKGVLVLNVVAGMDRIGEVQKNIVKILASTDFASGNRYEDFSSSIDKVAEYGIGGLIVGGILAKTGLLAKLGLILIKAWKIIAVGIVGLFAVIKKKFFGKKNDEVRTLDDDERK